jgi:hypothetical protein
MLLKPGKRYVARNGTVVIITATFGDVAVGHINDDSNLTKSWDVKGGKSEEPTEWDLVMELTN